MEQTLQLMMASLMLALVDQQVGLDFINCRGQDWHIFISTKIRRQQDSNSDCRIKKSNADQI